MTDLSSINAEGVSEPFPVERVPWEDVAVFPETARVSVRLTGEGYRKSAVMDYWEGTD